MRTECWVTNTDRSPAAAEAIIKAKKVFKTHVSAMGKVWNIAWSYKLLGKENQGSVLHRTIHTVRKGVKVVLTQHQQYKWSFTYNSRLD